jgi:hypothetical protein
VDLKWYGANGGVERKEGMDRNDGRKKWAALSPEKLPRVGPGKKSLSGEWSKGDEPPRPAPKKGQLCDYAKFGVTSGTIQRGAHHLGPNCSAALECFEEQTEVWHRDLELND